MTFDLLGVIGIREINSYQNCVSLDDCIHFVSTCSAVKVKISNLNRKQIPTLWLCFKKVSLNKCIVLIRIKLIKMFQICWTCGICLIIKDCWLRWDKGMQVVWTWENKSWKQSLNYFFFEIFLYLKSISIEP